MAQATQEEPLTHKAHLLWESLTPLLSKFPEATAFFQAVEGLNLYADTKQTQADPVDLIKGVVFSVESDGVLYEASTDDLTPEGLAEAVRSLLKLPGSDTRSRIPHQERAASFPEIAHFETSYEDDLSLDEKLSLLQNGIEKMQSAGSKVVSARVRMKHTLTSEIFLSAQEIKTQKLSRLETIYIAVLRDPDSDRSVQIFDGYGRPGGWENAKDSRQAMINKMIEDGNKLLYAERMEPGFYDCIFTPSVAGILAHEAFGHGTEADTMVRGRAKGSEYIGKRVASELVSIYDSPAIHEAASYFFDHEGQEARDTCIVENGILKNPITDQRSAKRLGIERSPNGRRQNYAHKAYSRMTNTWFGPGSHSIEEMVASIGYGFLVDRATNGMEDPKGWGIQLETLIAKEIKDGKLTGKVFSPVIVTGYVPDILESVSMLSKEVEFGGLGHCGKGHKEWVKVTDGGPFMKLRVRLA